MREAQGTREHWLGEVPPSDTQRPGWVNPAIAVLLTSGFFLRLVFYTGPIGSDDVSYFHFAQKLLLGESFNDLKPPNLLHQGGRLAFVAIIAVPAAWLDHIHFGVFANLLLFAVRDMVLTLFAYRALGGIPAAFAAAVLSLNPLSTVDASLMLPDGMTGFAMAGSSIAAYQALRTDDRRTLAWAFLSGVLAAIAYSAKDTGILVVAPTVLGILYWCRGRALVLVLASYGLGCALIVGLEMLVLWKLSGDPLYRFHAISAGHNQGMGPETELLGFARRVYWNLLDAVTKPLAGTFPVLWLFVPAAGIALFDRTRRLLFPVTGAFIALYLVFGTSGLSRLVPVPAQERYFEVVVPYVALCVAMAVQLIRPAGRVLVLPALIAFSGGMVATAAPSVAFNAGDVTFSGVAKNAVIALKTARDRYPELEIYASPDLLFALEPFTQPELYRRIKPYPDATPLPPGLYLMHPWRDFKISASKDVYRDLESMPVAASVNLDHRVASFLKLPPGKYKVLGEVRVRNN